jgi:hypothetical protein
MEVLKICKKISNFYISFKDTVKPENSIAWIINERSGLYGLEKKIRSPYENLFRIGIPIKAYLLSDLLKHPQLQKHKVFIFANCSYMTDEELEFIRDNLQKNGNTLIWSGIPPLFNGSKVLFERASKAVGFDLETSLDERFIDTISSGDLNFEPTNIKQSPVFWVKDKNIIPVAKLIGSDDVGIAIKKFPEWTSVYSALNELPPEFIRQLINGKLHVYSDSNDPVYISPHFIGIHSLNGGIRKISLPQRAIVYDAFKDEIISKNSKEIEIELLPESSSLFFYGDENFINACRMDIWGKK